MAFWSGATRTGAGWARAAFTAGSEAAGRPASAAALRYAGAGGAGAVVGAAIGGVTGAIDRDRGMISGAIGGAFWGGLAGAGGRAGMRHAVGAHPAVSSGARNIWPMTRMRGAYSATVMGGRSTNLGGGTRGQAMRSISSGVGGAAVVTGAYGTGNFLIGNSRKRKRYSRYGRSQGMY